MQLIEGWDGTLIVIGTGGKDEYGRLIVNLKVIESEKVVDGKFVLSELIDQLRKFQEEVVDGSDAV